MIVIVHVQNYHYYSDDLGAAKKKHFRTIKKAFINKKKHFIVKKITVCNSSKRTILLNLNKKF